MKDCMYLNKQASQEVVTRDFAVASVAVDYVSVQIRKLDKNRSLRDY